MRRILFVKTSSLGDVVHHCPAVSDAARKLPDALIDWVVEESFAEVVRMHPAVRAVIPVALRRWRRTPWRPSVWREVAQFRRAMMAQSYDAVIDSQGLVKSALVSTLASGTRHGMDRDSAREPLASRFYRVTHAVAKGAHAVERNRRLTAAALGYSLDEAPPRYGLLAAPDEPLVAGQYAVFLTMTSRDDKLWPESSWIELGRALGMKVLLPWGTESERSRARRIVDGIGHAALLSRMRLSELAGVFEKAQTVVGLDTGLTHMAAALGCATVGIYCASDPSLTGLYGSPLARNVGSPGKPPAMREVIQALA
jgi:heptosyltransferase I